MSKETETTSKGLSQFRKNKKWQRTKSGFETTKSQTTDDGSWRRQLWSKSYASAPRSRIRSSLIWKELTRTTWRFLACLVTTSWFQIAVSGVLTRKMTRQVVGIVVIGFSQWSSGVKKSASTMRTTTSTSSLKKRRIWLTRSGITTKTTQAILMYLCSSPTPQIGKELPSSEWLTFSKISISCPTSMRGRLTWLKNSLSSQTSMICLRTHKEPSISSSKKQKRSCKRTGSEPPLITWTQACLRSICVTVQSWRSTWTRWRILSRHTCSRSLSSLDAHTSSCALQKTSW